MCTGKSFFKFFAAFVFFFAASISAQNQDEMMKKWMDYMTPGDMHEMMAKSVGEWTYVSKYWMDPSAPPTVSEGRAINEMILGGRYLKSMNYGDVMGMPMEGMNLLAYDKAANEFFSFWIDNMGTGMTMARGKYDEKSKTSEMNGTMVDPMTGKDTPYRQVMKFIDEKTQIFEMFMIYDGKEIKSLEMTMTKK